MDNTNNFLANYHNVLQFNQGAEGYIEEVEQELTVLEDNEISETQLINAYIIGSNIISSDVMRFISEYIKCDKACIFNIDNNDIGNAINNILTDKTDNKTIDLLFMEQDLYFSMPLEERTLLDKKYCCNIAFGITVFKK